MRPAVASYTVMREIRSPCQHLVVAESVSVDLGLSDQYLLRPALVSSFAWVHTANSLLVSVARVKAAEYVKDGKLRTYCAPQQQDSAGGSRDRPRTHKASFRR
jgi:hypothetical protein